MRTVLRSTLMAAGVVALLAGCGGGGGGGGGTGGGGGGGGGSVTALGAARNVPDGTIAGAIVGTPVAGAANTVRITLSAGYPAVTSVQVGYTIDHTVPGTLVAATLTPGSSPAQYEAAVNLPNPMASGRRIFVRVTDSMGNVVETGTADLLIP